MPTRRSFITNTLKVAVIAGIADPFSYLMAAPKNKTAPALKLRVVLASDGHYGQPGTDYEINHTNLVNWLNKEHAVKPLDFIVLNGDLVHDKPELLYELKTKHLSRLDIPYYAVPGNHDHADTALWKSVFGYEDNHSFETKGIPFIMANTSNAKGEYICPDAAYLSASLEKYKNRKTVFIVLHIPPHQWTPENTFYKECPDILALIQKYPNVKAIFHGHDHSMDSVVYTGNRIPHFFDAHYGGNWGTAYYGYRVVEINMQDEIYTYQVNASKSPVLNTQKL